MEKMKLSSELISKINETEFPDIKIRCNRDGFYNEFNINSQRHKCEPSVAEDLHIIETLVKTKGRIAAEKEGRVLIEKPLELADEDIPQDMRNIGINVFRRKRSFDIDDELKCKDSLNFWKKYLGKGENNGYLAILERKTGIKIDTEEDLNEALRFTQWEDEGVVSGSMLTRYPHCITLSEFSFSVKKGNGKAMDIANKMISYWHSRVRETLFHELKHVKNALLCLHRPYASDYTEPTIEEKYQLSVENERTATFNSVNEALKEYLRAGNYQDFSMFLSKLDWVVDKLKGKSDKQIRKICYPPIKLMNECLIGWNNCYLEDYFGQFQREVNDCCCGSLLIPIDTTGKEFKKQRSMMYTYEVYNPYTGKTEMMDLSPMIEVDVPISDKVKKEILKPCEKLRKQKKEELYALIPDKKTEILAANFAETLKREKMAQWLAQSKNSDAEAILDRVRFAQPVKSTKRNFIAKKVKLAMSYLTAPERTLKYAVIVSVFALTTGAAFKVKSEREIENKNEKLAGIDKSLSADAVAIMQAFHIEKIGVEGLENSQISSEEQQTAIRYRVKLTPDGYMVELLQNSDDDKQPIKLAVKTTHKEKKTAVNDADIEGQNWKLSTVKGANKR